MTLTPIRKSDFNQKAADAVYDLVMKMDDDEAEVFVDLVVSDILEDLISKNLGTLQRTLDRVVSKRTEAVRKAMLTTVMKNNSPEAVAYAEAFAKITKNWIETEHPRARDGRFRTKVDTKGAKRMHDRSAKAMGIKGVGSKTYNSLTNSQKAQYQEEYRQLSNFLSAVQESTGGDADVLLHFKNKRGSDREWTVRQTGTKPDQSLLDPREHSLVGIEARPNQLNVGGAYFGLSSALGGTGRYNAATARTLNAVDSGMGSFADSWNAETSGRNSNERLYNRISAGSQMINGAAPPGGKIEQASRLAQFVGDHGAEAEAVFGPSARKAAYRYRGTSKTPDPALVTVYDRAVGDAKRFTTKDMTPVQMAAHRVASERRGSSWEERENGRAVVRAYLERNLPKKGLYNLQLASGNTPPSEGVLINADGKIVDQAVGYGDDHYLPFNLKHLKALRGGEYVRTRSAGGPTTEDIYTGLMTGARQLTVVSRSGTFVVKFADDFTGGRRHNDKAGRMTKRYAQLLDAVQSQQVDRQDISPDIRAAIVAQVREQSGGWGLPPAELHKMVEQRIEEFKESPDLSERDYELANYMSRVMQNRVDRGELSQQDADDFRKSVMNDLAAEKEYKFRLNEQGYMAALEALTEQFPYYLEKPKYIPPRANEARGKDPELDRGYVEPGRNRPTAAAAGLFGASTGARYAGRGGKFSAAEANYQGARGKLAPVPQGEKAALKPTGETKPEIKNVVEQAKRNALFAAAAATVQDQIRNHPSVNVNELHPSVAEVLEYTPADLADPLKQRKFDEVARNFLSQAKNPEWTKAYMSAAGHIGRVEFEPSMAGVWPAKPYTFGAKEKVEQRLAAIDQKTVGAVTANKRLSELSDSELAAEHAVVSALQAGLQGITDPADKATMLQQLGARQGAPGLSKVMSGDKAIQEHLKALHEVRFLNEGKPDEQRIAPMVVRPARIDVDAEAKKRDATLADQFGQAADWLAERGEDDKADELYAAAQMLHEAAMGDQSAVDNKAMRDALEQHKQTALETFRRMQSGGSILS